MVILMYHAFGRPGERSSRFVLPARRFSRQMAVLKCLGYTILSLEDYVRSRRDGRRPPTRSVVITIDDGYEDSQSVAGPILERYGYSATIFLVVDRVGGVTDWTDERTLSGRELLSWTDVREMQRHGIHFGAHALTHPRLTSLSRETARGQIVGSQMELARQTGRPVRFFAYPYGDSDESTRSIVAEAGFWASCGTQSGKNSATTPLQNLRRTEICGTDNIAQFLLKLWSGSSGRFLRRARLSTPRRRWRQWRQRLFGAGELRPSA